MIRALLESNWDVAMLSTSRPVYKLMTDDERCGWRSALPLYKGSYYFDRKLFNYAVPTFELPGLIQRYIPERISDIFREFYLWSPIYGLRDRCPELVVIESCAGITLYPFLRRKFPEASFVYRPSDPLGVNRSNPARWLTQEESLLKTADRVLLVNELTYQLFAKRYEIEDVYRSRWRILPNGVDVDAFDQKYQSPPDLPDGALLYVGAQIPDWGILEELAIDMNAKAVPIVVVCPERLARRGQDVIEKYPNVKYINGVDPVYVPAYIQNCKAFIVPYTAKTGSKPLGLHSKLLQAMLCKKPIVASFVDPELESNYGILVAQSASDFRKKTNDALALGEVQYDLDFDALSWRRFQLEFLREIDSLRIGNEARK